ncbi:hypothetical protein [Isoptericola sp. NPDC055881]
MRIRLALTLDIHRERHDKTDQHESTTDALVERADPHIERPTIGFGTHQEDHA